MTAMANILARATAGEYGDDSELITAVFCREFSPAPRKLWHLPGLFRPAV